MRQVRITLHEYPMSGQTPYGYVRCPVAGSFRTVPDSNAGALHAHTNGGLACAR